MGSPVLAQYTPLPISGEVAVEGPDNGIEVVIENLETGEEVATQTDSDGFYLVDWANTEYKYRSGDTFKITVKDETKEVTYEGDPLEVNFILQEDCPQIPEDCPEDTTPYEECDSCCPTPEKGEDWYGEIFIGLLGGAIGVLFGYKKGPKKLKEYAKKHFKEGQYVRLGKYYNGAISAKHLHKGISGYHDPEREHQDDDAKHPPGELAGKNVP